MEITYPRDIFGQRTGIWDDHSSAGWVGWDVYWSQVAGQRLNMGGSSAYIDHADAVGSTLMETDPAGGVQWDITRYPWGRVWQQTGTRGSAVFAGLDWQVNDPLIPSASREYNFRVYRWMTPDPGGRKVVKLDDPQTWNMYAYVGNNPTSLNDPSGMNACDPNDKSQSDCNVKIVIADRTKDKKGNYNDQFTKVNKQQNYNATAKVYAKYKKGAYALKGTFLIKTTPSTGGYPTIANGTYRGVLFPHRGQYPAIKLLGHIPVVGGLDQATHLPYATDIEIHRSGLHNYTGIPVSEGCSVVARCQYPSFESATGLTAPAPQIDFQIILGTSANGGGQ